MRIGEVSSLIGLSAATLCYYERIGLLPAPHIAGSGGTPPPIWGKIRILVCASLCIYAYSCARESTSVVMVRRLEI